MYRHRITAIATGILWTMMPAALAGGTTERVSVSSAERQANDFSANPQLSADGRFVAFVTTATNLVTPDANGGTLSGADVLVRDRFRGVTIRVDVSSTGEQANALAAAPGISRDGRAIAFHSGATNLVPGDTNNFFRLYLPTGQPI